MARWMNLNRSLLAISLWCVAGAAASCDSPGGATLDDGAQGDGQTESVIDSAIEASANDSEAADSGRPTEPMIDGGVDLPSGEGDAADGSMAPAIVSVTPTAVFRGDEFSVTGSNFLPMARAKLGNVALDPIQTDAGALTFRVPADFALRSCEEAVNVVIETDVGASPPASLVVRDPGPTLKSAPASIPAGATLELRGCNLTGAQVTIDGRPLTVQATETRLTVTIPLDTPAKLASLVVTTARGRSEVQTMILPPTPQIVTTDLGTVGNGGIVFITTDTKNKGLIDSVRIGDRTILVSDANDFIWSDQGSSPTTSRMAVRIPADAIPGIVNVALDGPSGASDPFPIMVIAPPTFAPPAAGVIVITPTAADPDGTFPIGTQAAFRVADPGITPDVSPWSYVISFYDSSPSGTTCTGIGTVSGTERHRRPPDTTAGAVPCRPDTHDACHPVTGTYVINGNGNGVMLNIDRTSTGGIVEPYVGGWVAADGTSIPAPGTNGSSYLVIRSLRTGIQISIRHGITTGCTR
jgi:hypothetical protein